MIGMFLFQKYLNRLDDFKFSKFWETKFVPHTGKYLFGALIYFIIGFGIILEILLFGNSSIFFAILVFFFGLAFYGSLFIRNAFRFLAINNQRYMMIKGGFDQGGFSQGESFSKDNVVG